MSRFLLPSFKGVGSSADPRELSKIASSSSSDGSALVQVLPAAEPWAEQMEELRRRLESRGADDADSRRRRFQKARDEIGHYPFFDYMIVNDELQRALAELRSIVLAEGCRQWRVAATAEALLQQ